MADDDKKRTQEGSETNFTTRGGRQDETSGSGKPQTSPCKRRPETPTEDATVADSPPTLSNALHTIPALADACSARDLLILSCVSKQTATFAEPGVWRRLRDREWPALPGNDAPALKKMLQALTVTGVVRSSEASLVARPPSDTLLQWRAELRARPLRKAARDAIDAARKAQGEKPLEWWRSTYSGDSVHSGKGIRVHSSYSLAERRIVNRWFPGTFQSDASALGYAGVSSWRLRATIDGRRLEDVSLDHVPDSTLGEGSHVHFPMCRGAPVEQSWSRRRLYRWRDEPAWYDEDRADELFPDDYDEDEDDRIYGGDDLWEEVTDGQDWPPEGTSGMGVRSEALQDVRLELDLVRVSDGAVARLASGVASGGRGYFQGTEVVWKGLRTADSFMRVHAEWQLNFEDASSCGLYIRFYDWASNVPSEELCWLSTIARIWAMYDIAASTGITVRAVPPTREEIDWREAVYAFQLVARRLDGISSDPARVISEFAYGVAPPLRDPSTRSTTFRALEYACSSSDAAACAATRKPRTWRWPNHELDDPSRYLFVAQVRGYWPAFARLYDAEGKQPELAWRSSDLKHHLEFRLRSRDIVRERAYDFSEAPLARFLTIHVVDTDDGRVADLPLSLYNLDGGQRPLRKYDFGAKGFPDDMPWIHPTCWADIDFHPWNDEVRSRNPSDYGECDLLRVDFKTVSDHNDFCHHVRLKRILAFVQELFWLNGPTAEEE